MDEPPSIAAVLRPVQPYDFDLSCAPFGRWRDYTHTVYLDGVLFRCLENDGSPCLITAVGRPKTILARLYGHGDKGFLRETAGWVTATDLDLGPFYRSADDVLRRLIRHLRGLKPPRTATAHEALVIAFTEQQITTRLARTFQNRMVLRYGKPLRLGELEFHSFPSPQSLAIASKEDLRHLGLSRNKADFIVEASRRIASGDVDLESLKGKTTVDAREILLSIKGVGEWTADYVLARGLGRPEMVPYYDLGARDTVGLFYLDGRRAEPWEVKEILSRFGPYAGLANWYLIYSRFMGTGLAPQPKGHPKP